MERKYILTNCKDNLTGVLMEDNKESRIEIYGASLAYSVDEIYVGRVKDVVPNINAAFVDIRPETTCYMSLDEKCKPVFLNRKNTDKVCQGDLLLVQVKKEPVKTKAGVVSCGINITGKYVALTRELPNNTGVSKKITDNNKIAHFKKLASQFLTEDYGYVIRTDAVNASDEEILNELKALSEEYEELLRISATRKAFSLMKVTQTELIKDITSMKLDDGDEIVTDIPDLYEELKAQGLGNVRLYEDKLLPLYKLYSIESRIENALKSHVWLKSGGYLIIEYTEAMTVIDVNTGKFDGNSKDREKTFLKINSEAAVEIPRQLRLRNLSGIIIVDFINMKSDESRKEIIHILERELSKDHVHAVFVDYTKLGLCELTRKKVKKPLHEYKFN